MKIASLFAMALAPFVFCSCIEEHHDHHTRAAYYGHHDSYHRDRAYDHSYHGRGPYHRSTDTVVVQPSSRRVYVY